MHDYTKQKQTIVETISIQINNPKTLQLIKDLEKLDLITLKTQITFQSVLERQ